MVESTTSAQRERATATTKVNSKPLSGFPEFSPEENLLFSQVRDVIRRNFELYGATPLDTPIGERTEVLTAKAGVDKEIYAFSRLLTENSCESNPKGALRFDLTVPTQRYVASNMDKLTFPFKRYQFGKVFRGDRPQAGRYREFEQCDIDTIGDGKLSIHYDAEMLAILYRIFLDLNIGLFLIRVNNRKILKGLMVSMNLPESAIPLAMRAIDKIEKIGPSRVIDDLVSQVGVEHLTASQIVQAVSVTGSTTDIIGQLRSFSVNSIFEEGVRELETVLATTRALGVDDAYICADISIARGLDYYTGTVCETRLVNHPELGSIASGGRYDDLANYFTSRAFPGVGISIGLTRLVPRLIKSGILPIGQKSPAEVMVAVLEQDRLTEYFSIGKELRENRINTEMFLETGRLGEQLKSADRKGIPLVVIVGETEFKNQAVQIKNLRTGERSIVPREKMIETITLNLEND